MSATPDGAYSHCEIKIGSNVSVNFMTQERAILVSLICLIWEKVIKQYQDLSAEKASFEAKGSPRNNIKIKLSKKLY